MRDFPTTRAKPRPGETVRGEPGRAGGRRPLPPRRSAGRPAGTYRPAIIHTPKPALPPMPGLALPAAAAQALGLSALALARLSAVGWLGYYLTTLHGTGPYAQLEWIVPPEWANANNFQEFICPNPPGPPDEGSSGTRFPQVPGVDPANCIGGQAVILSPGGHTRFGIGFWTSVGQALGRYAHVRCYTRESGEFADPVPYNQLSPYPTLITEPWPGAHFDPSKAPGQLIYAWPQLWPPASPAPWPRPWPRQWPQVAFPSEGSSAGYDLHDLPGSNPQVNPRPKTDPLPENPPTPPGKFQKEGKFYGTTGAWVAMSRLVNAVTETSDFVDALHEGVSYSCKFKAKAVWVDDRPARGPSSGSGARPRPRDPTKRQKKFGHRGYREGQSGDYNWRKEIVATGKRRDGSTWRKYGWRKRRGSYRAANDFEKALAIYRSINIESGPCAFDLGAALTSYVENQIEDLLIGQISSHAGKHTQRPGLGLGIGVGPAL